MSHLEHPAVRRVHDLPVMKTRDYDPATVGDFVVVHVGFALTCMDREEAERTLAFLAEMDELGELDIPQPG